MALRELAIAIGFQIDSHPLLKADRATDDLKDKVLSAEGDTRKFGVALNDVGNILGKNRGFIAGMFAATAGTIGFAVKTAADFEAEMSRVGALSRATKEELSILTDTARELGASTAFSATEVAQGMQYLAMAGYDVQEIVAAMPGLLYTAGAAQADLGTTSDIVSNILSGFGLQAEETIRVADVLTATFTSSNTTLQSLGNTMSYVAPVAASLGLEFEEVAALAGRLGDVGIQGERAGTALRAIFTRLAAPTGGAADLLDRLGISITDSSGRMLPMVDILRQLEEKTRDMGDAQRTATLQTLVGVEAVSALTALLDVGADNIANYADALRNSAGIAEAIYQQQQDNLYGALKALGSAFEEMRISIGNAFIPVIRAGADALRFVVNLFNKLPGPIKTVIAVGIGFVGMLSGAALAASFIIPQLSHIKSLLNLVKLGFSTVGRVLPGVTSGIAKLGASLNISFLPAAGIVLAVVGAILVLQDVFMYLRGEGDTVTGRFVSWFKDMSESLEWFAPAVKTAGIALGVLFGPRLLYTAGVMGGRFFASVVRAGTGLSGFVTQMVKATVSTARFGAQMFVAGVRNVGSFVWYVARAAVTLGTRLVVGLISATKSSIAFNANLLRLGWQMLAVGTRQALVFTAGILKAGIALGTQLVVGLLAATKAAIGFGLALLANPITWVIAGILALGAAVVMVVRHWDAIAAGLQRVFGAISDMFGRVVMGVRSVGGMLADSVIRIRDWIIGGFQAGLDWLLGLPGRTLDTLSGWLQSIREWFATTFNIGDVLGSAIQRAMEWIPAPLRGIAERILSFFPQSPAEEGPLANLDRVGPGLVQTVADSIAGADVSPLQDAMGRALGHIAKPASATMETAGHAMATPMAAAPSGAPMLQINVNVDARGATADDAERIGQTTADRIREVIEEFVRNDWFAVALQEV